MLTEYEGTIDSYGLCIFRQSQPSRSLHKKRAEPTCRVPFWAVMETSCAVQILRQLQMGERVRALRLLEELAFDLGCEWEKGVFDAEI